MSSKTEDASKKNKNNKITKELKREIKSKISTCFSDKETKKKAEIINQTEVKNKRQKISSNGNKENMNNNRRPHDSNRFEGFKRSYATERTHDFKRRYPIKGLGEIKRPYEGKHHRPTKSVDYTKKQRPTKGVEFINKENKSFINQNKPVLIPRKIKTDENLIKKLNNLDFLESQLLYIGTFNDRINTITLSAARYLESENYANYNLALKYLFEQAGRSEQLVFILNNLKDLLFEQRKKEDYANIINIENQRNIIKFTNNLLNLDYVFSKTCDILHKLILHEYSFLIDCFIEKVGKNTFNMHNLQSLLITSGSNIKEQILNSMEQVFYISEEIVKTRIIKFVNKLDMEINFITKYIFEYGFAERQLSLLILKYINKHALNYNFEGSYKNLIKYAELNSELLISLSFCKSFEKENLFEIHLKYLLHNLSSLSINKDLFNSLIFDKQKNTFRFYSLEILELLDSLLFKTRDLNLLNVFLQILKFNGYKSFSLLFFKEYGFEKSIQNSANEEYKIIYNPYCKVSHSLN